MHRDCVAVGQRNRDAPFQHILDFKLNLDGEMGLKFGNSGLHLVIRHQS
jgi:hypothetical protein